jgi:restriction endonuclease S subunit
MFTAFLSLYSIILQGAMMKLSEYCSISTGLILARMKLKPNTTGYHYTVLTIKSQANDGILSSDEFAIMKSKSKLEKKYITQYGDVLIRTTFPYTASFINNEMTGLVVPSNFCIIRITSTELNPEFLSIFLNSPCAKKQFIKFAYASTINSIKVNDLRAIEIPSIREQQKIVEIFKIKVKEIELLKKLIDEKEKLYGAIIKSLINTDEEGRCQQ